MLIHFTHYVESGLCLLEWGGGGWSDQTFSWCRDRQTETLLFHSKFNVNEALSFICWAKCEISVIFSSHNLSEQTENTEDLQVCCCWLTRFFVCWKCAEQKLEPQLKEKNAGASPSTQRLSRYFWLNVSWHKLILVYISAWPSPRSPRSRPMPCTPPVGAEVTCEEVEVNSLEAGSGAGEARQPREGRLGRA